jgi:hypothetical protein
MNDSGRRSDLFRRMRRQRSSPMHCDIAVVALPRLDEKSLSRVWALRLTLMVLSQNDVAHHMSALRPGVRE